MVEHGVGDVLRIGIAAAGCFEHQGMRLLHAGGRFDLSRVFIEQPDDSDGLGKQLAPDHIGIGSRIVIRITQ